MATHGDPEPVELSIRTTMAFVGHHLKKLIVYDSSSPALPTLGMLKELEQEYDILEASRVEGRSSWKHYHKIERGIRATDTELMVILDSDIEFSSDEVFKSALDLFNKNEKIFIVGEVQPMKVLSRGYIQEQQFSAGAIFLRTSIANTYLDKGVSFRPIQRREPRPGSRRMRVMYDVGGWVHKVSTQDGYHNIGLEPKDLVHFGGMSTTPAAGLKNLPEAKQASHAQKMNVIRERLAAKPWLLA